LPFVYDAHHHRCLADGLATAEVTETALSTWNREPLFHISSPRDGWEGRNPRFHHDFVDPSDIPPAWLNLERDLTVEVEAKAKELAVNRLRKDLTGRIVLFPKTESLGNPI
jgi:UV DNA damage endonuclease